MRLSVHPSGLLLATLLRGSRCRGTISGFFAGGHRCDMATAAALSRRYRSLAVAAPAVSASTAPAATATATAAATAIATAPSPAPAPAPATLQHTVDTGCGLRQTVASTFTC